MEQIHAGPEIAARASVVIEVPALLDEPLDESPALVWLKDLQGRYLKLNHHYAAFLDTSEDRLVGHTDDELAARETVDGPRSRGTDHALQEPLQLEYVVPAFDGRPALLVLRFPVRDVDGEAVAVCGVAAPVERANLARAEAERLMALQQRATRATAAEAAIPELATHAPEHPDRPDDADEAQDAAGANAPPQPAWPKSAERALSVLLARESAWRTVLSDAIAVLGSQSGWAAVTVWMCGEDGSLVNTASWSAQADLRRLEARQLPASSLLAHAVDAPHATWLTELDVQDDDRLRGAAADGLRCALLLPIRDRGAPIGLLELLTYAALEPDPVLAMSLEAAALRLGRLAHALGR